MTYYARFFAVALACVCAGLTVHAQTTGTNSSYSRFGLGLLADQSQSPNRSMGGVGQGLRSGSRINILNPASYSAIDSLSFLFDVGVSAAILRLQYGGSHKSYKTTELGNVNAGFRLRKDLGMSVGFVPFTNIGYDFSQEGKVRNDDYTHQVITQKVTYTGDGGLHEIYMGVGWRPFRGFSVGANLGYLWGDINNTVIQVFSENGTASANYSSLSGYYTASLRTWKGDVGVQYQILLNKQNLLTLGATVGIGHKIHSDASFLRTAYSGDSVTSVAGKAFQLPMSYSFGAAWEHAGRLTVAADATMEQWGNCVSPQVITGSDGTLYYEGRKGEYVNRLRINAGVEYVPDRHDRSYFQRVNYRLGAMYSSPYVKVNGDDGPREYSVTAGVGLPIQNNINNRSYVNVGLQWTYRRPDRSAMIAENMFRINIGLTFNERWFQKWKFR